MPTVALALRDYCSEKSELPQTYGETSGLELHKGKPLQFPATLISILSVNQHLKNKKTNKQKLTFWLWLVNIIKKFQTKI